MTDTELFALARVTLLELLSLQPLAEQPLIIRANQPTQAGRVDTGKALYLSMVGVHNHGWQQRTPVLNTNTGLIDYRENQLVESTFQLSALAADTDLLRLANRLMQTVVYVSKLRQAGVGILRVTDVRAPASANDVNQFEINASFDFTLTHHQVVTVTTPAVTILDLDLLRV